MNDFDIKKLLAPYLAKWYWIGLSAFIAVFAAWLNLRYSTNMYESVASIKIKDDSQNEKLKEISAMQNYSILANATNNIEDEAKIIKSRKIISQVVSELNLNTRFFIQGRIVEKEVFFDPPVNINFFASDSVVKKQDTTLYIKIISPEKFQMTGGGKSRFVTFDETNAREFAFGDRIPSSFGDFVITPVIGERGAKLGTVVKLRLEPFWRVLERYHGRIGVAITPTSSIINLRIKEALPEKGESILNELIRQYNLDVINDKNKVVELTSDFIDKRLSVVSSELKEVDLTAEDIKQNNRLSDIGSQSNLFLQSEKDTETKLINASNQLQMVDYMNDYINSSDSGTDLLPANVGIADGNVAQIIKNHNDLVIQRDRILRNSTEKNPTVVNLNNQINSLKQTLNQSLTNIKKTTQITINNLNKQEARIRSQIYATPRKERQFRDITRQQSIKESLYLYLLEKREEMAITLGMTSPNAKIIEPAYTNSIPVEPKRMFTYLAALILGAGLPLGIIYISQLLDSKVHTKENLKSLVSLPYLGDIPADKKKKLIEKVDYSPKAEAFRIIRTNIEFMLQKVPKNRAKIIFVTSTIAQEGKSHTSVNLARSFSFSEKKVLIIETDIRVPRVETYLKLKKNSKGLTDYIGDPSLNLNDVIVQPKENKYLDIIPSGTIPPNPAELLMSEHVSGLFEKVQSNYDVIIVDTSAVGLVTDTLLIGHHADLFIHVVSAEKVDKNQLNIVQSLYDEKRLPNMTVLLNGTVKRMGYGYGYGYGNGGKNKKRFGFI